VAEPARQTFSFEAYLELEEVSPVKHEFLAGEVWALAGGTPDHAAISVNVSTLVGTGLRGRACRVYSSDLRVRVLATGLGTYPDVTVVCGKPEFDGEDRKQQTVVNPRLIVEVLSPSTANYDRGEKLTHYQRIASLQEILLVSHDERRVDVWRRASDGWALQSVTAGSVCLESLAVEIPLAEIYRDPLGDSEALANS
jgi:Uma2 family endonuclease